MDNDPFGGANPARADLVLGGRYRLLTPVGMGGMAVVWQAWDTVLARAVAVKLLSGRYAGDPSSRARVQREARAAAALAHPNVAQVYDYGESVSDGQVLPYVVMELVRGETLQQRMKGGPVSPRFAMRLCAEVGAALAAAHAEGLVHRDIKPANVLLAPTGAKVVDFGIAAAITPTGSGTDEVFGTPSYLAPERLTDDAVQPASDVFSLGVLLYRLLSGQSPWTMDTTTQLLAAHIHIDPAPLSPASPVPEHIVELCMRCLSKFPAERPSASEVARLLAHAAGLAVVEDETTAAQRAAQAASAAGQGAAHPGDQAQLGGGWSGGRPQPSDPWAGAPSAPSDPWAGHAGQTAGAAALDGGLPPAPGGLPAGRGAGVPAGLSASVPAARTGGQNDVTADRNRPAEPSVLIRSPIAPPPPPKRKSRRPLLVGGALVLAALATAGWALLPGGKPSSPGAAPPSATVEKAPAASGPSRTSGPSAPGRPAGGGTHGATTGAPKPSHGGTTTGAGAGTQTKAPGGPAATTPTAAPTTTTAAPEPVERTFTTSGGTVTATCTAPATARILSSTAAKPYKVDSVDSEPGSSPTAVFRHGKTYVTVTVTCSDSVPSADIS